MSPSESTGEEVTRQEGFTGRTIGRTSKRGNVRADAEANAIA